MVSLSTGLKLTALFILAVFVLLLTGIIGVSVSKEKTAYSVILGGLGLLLGGLYVHSQYVDARRARTRFPFSQPNQSIQWT